MQAAGADSGFIWEKAEGTRTRGTVQCTPTVSDRLTGVSDGFLPKPLGGLWVLSAEVDAGPGELSVGPQRDVSAQSGHGTGEGEPDHTKKRQVRSSTQHRRRPARVTGLGLWTSTFFSPGTLTKVEAPREESHQHGPAFTSTDHILSKSQTF